MGTRHPGNYVAMAFGGLLLLWVGLTMVEAAICHRDAEMGLLTVEICSLSVRLITRLSVSRSRSRSVSKGNKIIPWSDFKSVNFHDGNMRIHKTKEGMKEKLLTGGTITIPVSTLPNFYSLMAFIEALPKLRWS